MKKILFLFVIIASVAVCSCKSSGNDDQNNAAGNELFNADSISVDQFEDLLEEYISNDDVAGIQRVVAAANSTLNKITNKAEKSVFADRVKSIIRAHEGQLSKWFDVNSLLENILRVVPDVTQPVEQTVQSDTNVYRSETESGNYDGGGNPTIEDPSQQTADPTNQITEPAIPDDEPNASSSNASTGTSTSNTPSPAN